MSQIMYSGVLSITSGASETVSFDLKKGSAGNYTVQGVAGAPVNQIKYVLSVYVSSGKATVQIGSNTTHKIAVDTDISFVSNPLLWIAANYIIITAVDGDATVNVTAEEYI